MPTKKIGTVETSFRLGKGQPVVIRRDFESYYDAQCSVRGNYWAARQVGQKLQFDSELVTLRDSSVGIVTITAPSGENLSNSGDFTMDDLRVTINGENFEYESGTGSRHTYVVRDYATLEGLRNRTIIKTKVLNLEVKVDGATVPGSRKGRPTGKTLPKGILPG